MSNLPDNINDFNQDPDSPFYNPIRKNDEDYDEWYDNPFREDDYNRDKNIDRNEDYER